MFFFFFCTDLHGYVKRFLDVNGEVFDVLPIAKALKLPEKLLPQIVETWSDDECQLEVILQRRKGTSFLREALEGLKQGKAT